MRRFLRLLPAIVLTLSASPALAGVSLGISGTDSTSNSLFKTKDSGGISATISLDLGSYFRIGYTHRQATETEDGWEAQTNGTETSLVPIDKYYKEYSNAIDLTVVLYQGQIFTPFIFGGGVCKRFRINNKVGDQHDAYSDKSECPLPNGGFGLAINLNQNFSLRFSRTYSAAGITVQQQEDGSFLPKRAIDVYSQYGITYKL